MNIRPVTEKDAAELLGIYAPYVKETAVSFEYEAPSIEEFKNRIRTISEKYPYILAENGDEILGYAYANTFKARRAYDWAVEISIYVKSSRRGMGTGKMLYAELERILCSMNITNMNACITHAEIPDEYLRNESEAFHEKAGFKKAAHFHGVGYKFGRRYDMIWMEKIISEHTDEVRSVRKALEECGY